MLIRAVPLRDELGNIVKWYGTSTDIEDRKQAEEALREQASLLNLTHDTVFVRDMHDVITYWNRGAEELYGWTREEAVGKVTHQLTQTIFPAPLAEINTELLRTGRWEGELIHTKRDGTQVVVASRWSLQRDEQGRPAAILETNNDITERKRAEDALRKAQTELAHVTRVMTVGELAASIAHEVNQPLTGVITNGNACLRWLGRTPPDVDEAREAVTRMIRDGSRASEVMARIRTLLRKAEPQKTRLAINDVIGEVIALAESEVHRNRVLLKTDLAADFPPVLADRIQLQQVLLNLMLNGMEAMRAVTDRSRELIIRSQAEETDAIRVAVQDAGVGIDPQDMDRIFTAFFTTKPEGLGMGLAISRSIIEAHGGRLWATPNAGPGATFQFTLPTHRESAS
jgi:two-component system sensor kinase FixL